MTNRIPRWELHIQPMFSLFDNDHMGYLNDVKKVWAKRSQILRRLKARPGSMPPPTEHGPWPDEWVGLFERWIQVGENELGGNPPMLELAKGSNLQVRAEFGGFELSGKVPIPEGEASKSYFFIKSLSDETQEYFLYLEVDPNGSGSIREKTIFASINPTPGLTAVVIHDANGKTRLSVL